VSCFVRRPAAAMQFKPARPTELSKGDELCNALRPPHGSRPVRPFRSPLPSLRPRPHAPCRLPKRPHPPTPLPRPDRIPATGRRPRSPVSRCNPANSRRPNPNPANRDSQASNGRSVRQPLATPRRQPTINRTRRTRNLASGPIRRHRERPERSRVSRTPQQHHRIGRRKTLHPITRRLVRTLSRRIRLSPPIPVSRRPQLQPHRIRRQPRDRLR
jgi:hypothetical protein